MRGLPLLLALALCSTPLRAGEAAPLKWRALLEKAAESPVRHEHQGRQSRSLSHVEPGDRRLPRDADYFNVIGWVDAQGAFHATGAALVIEEWRRPQAGVWAIEQRLLGVELDGRLRTLTRQLLVEKDDGQVLDIRTLPGRPDDPAEQALLASKLESWFAWLGL